MIIGKILKNLIIKRKRNLNITKKVYSKKILDKIYSASKDDVELYNDYLIPIGSAFINNIDLNI